MMLRAKFIFFYLRKKGNYSKAWSPFKLAILLYSKHLFSTNKSSDIYVFILYYIVQRHKSCFMSENNKISIWLDV